MQQLSKEEMAELSHGIKSAIFFNENIDLACEEFARRLIGLIRAKEIKIPEESAEDQIYGWHFKFDNGSTSFVTEPRVAHEIKRYLLETETCTVVCAQRHLQGT